MLNINITNLSIYTYLQISGAESVGNTMELTGE